MVGGRVAASVSAVRSRSRSADPRARFPDGRRRFGAHRRASPHREAVRNLPHWCDEAAFAEWEQDKTDWPAWEIAQEKLATTARLVSVLYPSEKQKAGRIESS